MAQPIKISRATAARASASASASTSSIAINPLEVAEELQREYKHGSVLICILLCLTIIGIIFIPVILILRKRMLANHISQLMTWHYAQQCALRLASVERLLANISEQ